MYDNQYIVTYLHSGETENEQYRQDFLAVLGMSEFEDEQINAQLFSIYNSIVSEDANHPIIQLAKRVATLILSEDSCLGFLLLFSYQYFYYTHQCIVEWNTTHTISNTSFANLKAVVDIDVKQ